MLRETKNVLRKYAVFKGRSSRKEFWSFILFELCIFLPLVALLAILEGIKINDITASAENMAASIVSKLLLGESMFTSPWVSLIKALLIIFALGLLVPRLAVTIRRLHDVDKSGLYYLLRVVPEIIVAIVIKMTIDRPLFAYKKYYFIIFSFVLLIVGNIVVLVFLCKRGNSGTNRYGAPTDSVVFGGTGTRNIIKKDKVKHAVADSPMTVHEPEVHIKALCNSGAIAGQIFSSSDTLCIGRSKSSCNVVFPENTKGISRVHCCLKIDHGQPILMDLGSSYGTFLENGKRLQPNVPVRINDNTRFYLADKNTWFTAYIEIR